METVWWYGRLILLLSIATALTSETYKLCSLPRYVQECDQVDRFDQVNCVKNDHGIDCLLNIENGKTDFGSVTPEEALIAANFLKNVTVIGEFRPEGDRNLSLYSTVILVKADYTGGFQSLKGKKFCHPGFTFDHHTTDFILKEFERTVLKENNIDICSYKANTLAEKELNAVHDFFGPSCRPRPWSDLEDQDNKYFKQYSKLCNLCGSDKDCFVPISDPFWYSLNCMINGEGEVALTTINTVDNFFNKIENVNKKNNYQYLCRDGNLRSLDDACTWTKQPWNLLVAHKDKAPGLKKELESWLPKDISSDVPIFSQNSGENFAENLKKILFPREPQYNKINLIAFTNLDDYIKSHRQIPNIEASKQCNEEIKWCTVSDEEHQKCLWLAQASTNQGFLPVVGCVQEKYGKVACLEDIKNGIADVVTSDAHYGYISRKKKLSALAYPETRKKDRINIVVVIKDKNKDITRFENLKSKRACIPEYGGIEWLAFINTARDRKVMSKSTCNYHELIIDFVGDSCMPGAHDLEHEISDQMVDDKLCSLCRPHPYNSQTASTCDSSNKNQYYGSNGSLICLQEAGDYAVITASEYAGVNEKEFRVLCKNGSLAQYTGFTVDAECYLTQVVDSEVVAKHDNSKKNDIQMMLLNFERRFGTDSVKPFEVFNIFNNTLDLLFKDSTPGLDAVTSNNKYISNFVEVVAHMEKCTTSPSGAGNLSAFSIWVLVITTGLHFVCFK